MDFLRSLKTLFADQEIEITIKSVKPGESPSIAGPNNKLSEMIRESRTNAPVISPEIDIRALLDESQYPGH